MKINGALPRVRTSRRPLPIEKLLMSAFHPKRAFGPKHSRAPMNVERLLGFGQDAADGYEAAASSAETAASACS